MVSIILCTYNRATLVGRAIRSVLDQSHTDWELIVVDDGSGDGTHEVIAEFILLDPRIRYYYQHNQGLAAARNIGMRLARGKFMTFLDSDDEYAPDHIRQRVDFIKSHPDVDMIHGGVQLIGPEEKQYVVDLTNPTRKIHLGECHTGGTFFFRSNVAREIEGFRALAFGEDFDFFLRTEQRFIVKKVEYPTYRYHLTGDDRLCEVFTRKLLKE